MHALGIDIGGSSVKVAVVVDGRPKATARSGTYIRPDRPTLLNAVRRGIAALPRPASGRFDAIGLCVPGLRDASGRLVIASANVPGIVGLDLHTLPREAMVPGLECLAPGAPLIILGDAHAAAIELARMFPEHGPDRRLLCLSIGTGVGACILDGDSPLRVSGASPGHLGQIDVSIPLDDGSVPLGPDGGRGGLEAYIGLSALLTRLGPPAETLAERMPPGDPALRALARALRIAHAIYRPDAIALAGGVGIRLASHGPAIRALVDSELTGVARPGWRLVFGTSDFHAAIGAAITACGATGSTAGGTIHTS